MAELSIIISLFGFASSLSSIIFAYLAFKRNNHIDSKEVGEESGQLQADIKYIVKTLAKLEEEFVKSDDRNRLMLERLAKVEQTLKLIQK